MKFLTLFFIIAAGWLCGFASPLLAQTDDEVMAAYSAYNAALKDEDAEAALKHSRAAYELAEAAWGSNRNETALLAINYADQLYARNQHRAAAEIYERCIELLQEHMEESRFNLGYCYLRYGMLAHQDRKKRKAEAAFLSAVETLLPLVEADLDAAVYVGQSYLSLAVLSAPGQVRAASPDEGAKKLAQRLEESRDYAKKAEPLLIRGLGEDAALVGHAYLIEGYYYEWARDWNTARDLYEKAHAIFEKHLGQDDIETRRALGRYSYADALVRQEDIDETEQSNESRADGCREIERDGVEITICPIKRRAPKFPSNTAFKGQSGFALVEFDIDETGAVVNPRIVESWPGDEFDKATLRAVHTWRYKPPVNADGNVVFVAGIQTFVRFELKW